MAGGDLSNLRSNGHPSRYRFNAPHLRVKERRGSCWKFILFVTYSDIQLKPPLPVFIAQLKLKLALEVHSGIVLSFNKIFFIRNLCPLQEGTVECGYYVMKYMKEIIDDPNCSIITKEIDALRIEWVEYVDDFIPIDETLD
ncbi:hypothetical protein DVH24_033612 [Malus domestica]|uniref:Ubiquitin-like protease family profile domain-containing protein n=1 Tax=Malus domestica TaxID=3750 RepID=A0A498JC53_MALDO|nr:hypothetical protein DVH24_033612 [Malus domestica]